MGYEKLLTEVRGRVAVLTLNRPEALNALDNTLGGELRRALIEYDRDEQIGAIVLTGAGRAFCSGADVKGWKQNMDRRVERGAEAQAEAPETARTEGRRRGTQESWRELLTRIKPVVCAYNGDVIGAGLTLTLAADYKVASERARFSMRFARMGIAPEIESSRLLAAMIGLTNAMPLMISGDIIDGKRAFEIGLVNELVDHDSLVDRAVEVAARLAEVHPDTTRSIKQLVHANLFEPDAATVRQRETDTINWLVQRPSYREAVKAFVEKRKADFWQASST